jgi:tripartite-type tricarboxylate transporter receptor subunit TctC
MRSWIATLAVALCALAPAAPAALAQAYPSRPVRLIVPFPPGGVTDIVGRILAQRLGESLGQQVLVDNRGGAAGAIGAQAAAKSAPDGYTLLMATATHAINATLIPNPNFDLVKDLAPVSLAASVPLLLAVNPSFPARDVKELVAAAAARPGQINFASGSTGSASHLAGEMLKTMARVDMVHIPYKGGSLGIQDLVAGQVQLMFENMPSILPFVQSGRLRGLAVTSAKRSPAAPDLPTMIESGYPGFEAGSWYGLFAPAGTPAEILARLNADMAKSLRSPETRKLLSQQGAEPVGNSEAEFAAFIRAEIAKWGRVIKAANVKID